MKFIAITFLALIFAAGCTSPSLTGIPDKWPENWPKLEPIAQNECPNISGTYKNIGESVATFNPSGRALSYLALQHFPSSENSYVTIEGNANEQIEITVFTDTAILKQQTLSRESGHYSCDKTSLWLEPRTETAADGTGYSRSNISLGLQKANGGVLAGQTKNKGFGLCLWAIPIAGIQTIWYKWEPAKQ
jgi:hypothetical protein